MRACARRRPMPPLHLKKPIRPFRTFCSSARCERLLGDDFDAELDRLYRAHVALPRWGRAQERPESTRAWIKDRINDAFSEAARSPNSSAISGSRNSPSPAIH